MMKRRHLLKLSGIGALTLNLPLPVFAQSLTTTSLGSNLSLISGAGCNVIVAVGSENVVVVDGGLQENTEALLREIERLAQGKPITTLFNTNWRPEHTGLNHALGDVDIIAHENTRLWQGADFFVDWEGKDYSAMPAAAQANKTFYKTGSLQLDGETIEYGVLPLAHTDGDIYVHFTQADVLVVSDALSVGEYPLLDYVTGGWIGGAQSAVKALIERASDNTQVIAANGGVFGMKDLEAQDAMLTVAYDGVSNAFRTGRSLTQFKEVVPMAEFSGERGSADLFLSLLYNGTWYHVPGRAVPGII